MSWWIAYLVHSTVLTLRALAAGVVLRGRGLHLQEALLKLSLVGGVLGATAHVLIPRMLALWSAPSVAVVTVPVVMSH